VLPPLKAKGSFHISCTSHCFQLRQHYEVLILVVVVVVVGFFFFKKELLERKEIAISAKS
jgi:hypothetical protein